MSVHVNGEALALAAPLTITELLEHLRLTGQRLAVEVNGDIVPRSQHQSTQLHDGDRVEIVRAIGGG